MKKTNEIRNNEFIIEHQDTLLHFLLENVHSSRNNVKSLLSHQQIQINGRTVSRFDYPLKEKDVLKIGSRAIEVNPRSIISVLYEDEQLIAIDKPAGLLSISTDKEKEKTAYHLVSQYLKERNKNAKIFVLHRLDKDTSGVLVFCKNESIRDQLQANWNEIVSLRQYTALVEGTFENKSGHIENCLKENRQGMVYLCDEKDPQGKKAITDYRVIRQGDNTALLDVRIQSGRKNQIRVTFSSLNHPVVGDLKYGSHFKGKRLFLHASALAFTYNGKTLKIQAPLPKGFSCC